MGQHCHTHDDSHAVNNPGYKKVLWIVMLLNLAMFFVEVFAGYLSKSTSLLADSLDFAGDAGTYAISIFVLSSHIHTRAKASLFKAAVMFVFGLWVIGTVIYQVFSGDVPRSDVMGAIGVLALVVNLFCAIILYKFREGDSNMLSVWLCTRNDAIGNLAVVLAAGGVYLFHSNLPDLLVAMFMGSLGIYSSILIMKRAKLELRS